MKLCYICKQSKPLDAFGVARRRKDGRQAACKDCRNSRARDWYAENRELHISRVASSRASFTDRRRAFIYDWLLDHPCTKCGETDPVVLDFDHRDPATKEFNIGEAAGQGISMGRLVAEMAKCDVLCAFCHRRKTARDCDSYRHRRGVANSRTPVLE